jgi:hypothetical protein
MLAARRLRLACWLALLEPFVFSLRRFQAQTPTAAERLALLVGRAADTLLIHARAWSSSWCCSETTGR